MKSFSDFQSEKDYWLYVHTQATLSAIPVLITKTSWANHTEMIAEAVLVADATVKALKKKYK